jgi:Na+-transporting methylmalonyl-CoA/oxaloacetate decarboxylase gamma subunit
MQTFQLALQISLVGMGLVFLGILVLWAMMALLVRFFADKPKNTDDETTQSEESEDKGNKRLAAAIAAATAIEMQNISILSSSHKERESISAWQAAHRSQQYHKNRPSFSRKN